MLRSLYSGISGMKVNQVKMDVIGNNIANVGTTAFKSGRVRFQDMLSQRSKDAMAPMTNLGGSNPSQVGLGVQIAGIDTMVSQGMMQPTSNNLDVAIDGDGYFMVGKGPEAFDKQIVIDQSAGKHKITANTGMQVMYSRDGSFTLDSSGNLLTSDGYRVMGYSVTPPPLTAAEKVDAIAAAATATADAVTATAAAAALPADVAPSTTKADATAAAVVTTAAALAATTAAAAGTELLTGSSIDSTGVISFVNASRETKADDGFLKCLRIPDKVLVSGTVGAANAVYSKIKTFSISKEGLVTAVLDNDKVTVLGQIATTTFKNPAGLSKMGKNLYSESGNSGTATIRSGVGTTGEDNSKGYGDLTQGMLEMSNVDLAEQFTDMIVTSRAFQASAKTITTGDEILQDIINLKR